MSTYVPSRPTAPARAATPRAPRTASSRAEDIRFRRALTLMAMTLVLPGSAQLVAGNRRVGRAALRTTGAVALAVLVAALVAWQWHGFAFWVAFTPWVLLAVRTVLMLLAVGWAALLVDAWRLGDPLTLRQRQRLVAVGVNGVLCFSVAGGLLFGAHVVGVQRDFVVAVAGDGQATAAHHGRYNVLLMGGDSGADRFGMRPDSMTVASIDKDTGETVLVSLPRNMANFPFREGSVMAGQFPDGFDCDGCYLNGVSTWALDHTDLFPGSKTPGIDATISAIEGITDLRINYWAMVNMQGFRDLVDAFGGVKLHIRSRIPVGGVGTPVSRYIEPGERRLSGYDALWFARSRADSDDYSRMARQKCVMNALLQQVSPSTAMRNFEKIMKASSEMVSTNLPAGEFDDFLSLALDARSAKIRTVSLVPPLITTAHPDIAKARAAVRRAIAVSDGTARKPSARHGATGPSGSAGGTTSGSATGSGGASPAPAGSGVVTGGSLGSLKDGYAANASDDLDAVC